MNNVTFRFASTMLSTTTMLLLVVVASVRGADVQDSKILVHIPFHLHDPNGFDHIAADFGFGSILNSYQSLSEYVYYIEETLCYPVTNHSIGHPTTPADQSRQTPFILFIQGGGVCSHATKVRHGQMIGASAVVLAQPSCSCSDTNCSDIPCEDDSQVVLVNDGSAADISIPSFYLKKPFSEQLKDQLRKNQPVLMELQWGLSESIMNEDGQGSNNKPQIQFWTTAYDPHVRLETYMNIRTISQALSDHIDFLPQYSIINGTRYNCLGTAPDSSSETCDHLCTNFGRYCTNHATDLSGYAIVQETLRRLCIWEYSTDTYLLQTSNDVSPSVTGSSNSNKHSMFWDYVIYHKKECGSPSTFADVHCVEKAMKQAKIDPKKIDQCMTAAGSDTTNSKFDEAMKAQQRMGVVTLPSLAFNKHVLSRTSGALLFEIVCTEYWMSDVRAIPDICIKCASCPNTVGCVEHSGKCVDFKNEERYINPSKDKNSHKNDTKPKKKHRFWSTLGWLLLFGCAAGAAYYYYETQLKETRRSGTRPLMNDYLHLNMDG
jgi:hypothetical protein